MKRYYVDYSGSFVIEAESVHDAENKAWAAMHKAWAAEFEDDVWYIEGIEEVTNDEC